MSSEACTVLNLPFGASRSGAVVDPLTYHPNVHVLSPAMAAGNVRENSEKVEEPTLPKLLN